MNDEPRIAVMGYIPSHGPVATHRLSDLEAAADTYLRLGARRPGTPAEAAARRAELDALLVRMDAGAVLVDASELRTPVPTAETKAAGGGGGGGGGGGKTVREMTDAFWARYASRRDVHRADRGDGTDRSVAPGNGPAQRILERIVGAQDRPARK